MNTQTEIIYHIVSSADFKSYVIGSMYAPESLFKNGFIHCASREEDTLLIAEDYFDKIEGSVYLIKIIVDAVLAPVRFEESSFSLSAGKKHPESGVLFPHIYGSLNLDAVEGLGVIRRSGDKFLWPETFSAYISNFY
jgi:uncharacterized protein (DUF952 family)